MENKKAIEIWAYISTHQDTDTGVIAKVFNITKEDMTKLILIWATGAKDSFEMAVECII
jgi:hypothetical protein